MTEPLGEEAGSDLPNGPPAPKAPLASPKARVPVEGERTCTACGRCFGPGTLFCPDDGTPLEVRGQKTTDPYVGQLILEHIEIQKLAGVGAMGRVYRAFQRGLERDVAVKVLHRELSSNKELVGRFIREAKLASRIVHPNVVQVHLAGQLSDGALYIVMEYLDGLSLQSATAASPTGALPLERWLHVALQLCQAVGEAHGLGIVHRDLKPENVMLVRRGDDRDFVKVLDFGIARASQADHASMATAQGLIFGTARYISPEGARGEPATPASDVYSLAILFYQLLAGQTPFDAEQAVGLLLQHIHETPPPLSAPPSHPPIPDSIAKVILGNLAKSPDDRSADAKRFGEELRRAAREEGLIVPELETHSRREGSPKANRGNPGEGSPKANPNATAQLLDVTPPPAHFPTVTPAHAAVSPGPPRTEYSEPEARRAGSTEYAEPGARARGLGHNGTLRLDTPPAALVSRLATEVPPYVQHGTLPVVSRPVELSRMHTPRLENAPRSEPAPRSLRWLVALLVPVVIGLGLVVGSFFKSDAHYTGVKPELSTGAGPAAPPEPTDLVPAPPDTALVGLLPGPGKPPGPGPVGPRVPVPPASAGVGQEPGGKAGAVRVTVGRSMQSPIPNQPIDFTAVVFDGAERATGTVEAANFSFRGEGMNSILPAQLDGQGIFRCQLTFYKPGTYDVVFGGMLHNRSIGGSHRFTVTVDGAPPPRASAAPQLPGPNDNGPPPKPATSVQWL